MSRNPIEIAAQVATGLITSAGLFVAVQAADIKTAVRNLDSVGDGYTQSQMEKYVDENIRKTHRPGVTGSL